MLLVYCQYSTPRIEYICSTLFTAIGVSRFTITNNKQSFAAFEGVRINYSSAAIVDDEIWMEPVTLLFEDDIHEQQIGCFSWKEYKAFFKSGGNVFPFDVFAASFYLISRYEEYLPHTLDMYGRYAHENSIAFKEEFLQLPLVNLWLQQLKEALMKSDPSLLLTATGFTFVPTYDIDIAFSYKEKGVVRNTGGLLKSITKGDWKEVKDRMLTIASLATDPFDVYEWLDDLHQQYQLKPIYFYLLASANSRYDKNILPSSSSLRFLIEGQAGKNIVGIHPSWQSGDNTRLLPQEMKHLQAITGKAVTRSRQHYIRMQFPTTYRRLIEAGITEDYSMGYGSINGFRASYCLPYKWFDLEKNEATGLTILPFCFMEANSLFEQRYTSAEAAQELQAYYNITKQVDGLLITIFHNHLITEQPSQIEWRRLYENFVAQNFGKETSV